MNTIMYKLCCKDENIKDIYVGHTTNKKQRNVEHRYACNNENSKSYNSKLYSFIRNNGGYNNWEMIEIEKYPCNTRQEALIREHYHYFNLKSTLNDISPVEDLDKKQKHIEKIRNNKKELTRLKLEKKKEERLKYLEDNKDAILEHKRQVRREYSKKNRERINEKMREYNKKNNEVIKNNLKKYYHKRCLKNKSAIIIQKFFKKYCHYGRHVY